MRHSAVVEGARRHSRGRREGGRERLSGSLHQLIERDNHKRHDCLSQQLSTAAARRRRAAAAVVARGAYVMRARDR